MLAPWKKSYEKYKQYIQKQRHHFAKKGPYCQSYGFSSSHVWLWELDHKEGWAEELAEELMFSNWGAGEDSWESPLDCNEIKQVLKETNPEYTLEGLMLKLKLQYFGHLYQLIGKDLYAGKDWGKEKKEEREVVTVDGTIDSMDVSLSKLQEIVKDGEDWHAAVHARSQTWLSDWTTIGSLL